MSDSAKCKERENTYLATVEHDIAHYKKKRRCARNLYRVVSVFILVLSAIAPPTIASSDKGLFLFNTNIAPGTLVSISVLITVATGIANGLMSLYRWNERWRDASLTYRTIERARDEYLDATVDFECGSDQQKAAMIAFRNVVEAAKTSERTSFFEAVVSDRTREAKQG
ncbi:DUF4231 domain-containing protein [Rhizobium leguminosarum]|uniref:DUF4231 domain-containing protein n=1 Tax=Rhizobium leguminosarum TaxID=384 RepID=UPI00162090DB|nr:DUF4231 domain-containing protein [Rhizobium leguminosarum]MBB4345150.1 hypothetical protein [Rhizobium leguminosarum]MBB6298221.1 hypothetical protein [Rhizobium leguminosarum]